jgi:hypothetical protein
MIIVLWLHDLCCYMQLTWPCKTNICNTGSYSKRPFIILSQCTPKKSLLDKMQHTALQQFGDISKLNSQADRLVMMWNTIIQFNHSTVQFIVDSIVMICDQDRVFFCSDESVQVQLPLHYCSIFSPSRISSMQYYTFLYLELLGSCLAKLQTPNG